MLSKLKLKRITSLNRCINADIIALKTNNLYSAVNILITRGGIMQGGSNFALEDASLSEADALTAFIIQYYSSHEIPEEIITAEYCEKELLENFFLENFDKKVDVVFAKQGVGVSCSKWRNATPRNISPNPSTRSSIRTI